MIVKVCGITRKEQFSELDELGVDMIGLNFYKPSQRYLRDVIKKEKLGNSEVVGVFVNPAVEEIREKSQQYALDLIQLHGDETADFVEKLAGDYRIIKAFGVDEGFDFSKLEPFEPYADYFLFDTKTTLYGGSGRKFNWQQLKEYRGDVPFLLSGGIRPEDVADIAEIDHQMFAGVDINSGFERSPGDKNIELVKRFLTELKNEKSG